MRDEFCTTFNFIDVFDVMPMLRSLKLKHTDRWVTSTFVIRFALAVAATLGCSNKWLRKSFYGSAS